MKNEIQIFLKNGRLVSLILKVQPKRLYGLQIKAMG